MQPIDPQTNGPQLLYGMRYHIHINTAEEDITFHEQVGYWLWEPATGLVMQNSRSRAAKSRWVTPNPRDTLRFSDSHARTHQLRNCSTDFLEKSFRNGLSYRIEIT